MPCFPVQFKKKKLTLWAFSPAETLRDCSTDSELHWMKEIDYDEDADSEEEGDEDEVIDVQDLCRLTGAEGWEF